MKLSALAIVVAAFAAVGGGPVLAQTATPPVTMQPIANPPEKMAKPHGKHHAKHHAKKAEAAESK